MPFGIKDDTQLPDYTRLPSISPGSEVVVLLTEAKESKGTKGHYAIFEGKISEVLKGDHAKGETVKVLMTRLDDSRRIIRNKDGEVNYAQIEVMEFLKAANGGPFPKENLAASVAAFCANIAGVAVKVVSRLEEDDDGKSFPKRTFVTVPGQTAEALAAQRKLLETL